MYFIDFSARQPRTSSKNASFCTRNLDFSHTTVFSILLTYAANSIDSKASSSGSLNGDEIFIGSKNAIFFGGLGKLSSDVDGIVFTFAVSEVSEDSVDVFVAGNGRFSRLVDDTASEAGAGGGAGGSTIGFTSEKVPFSIQISDVTESSILAVFSCCTTFSSNEMFSYNSSALFFKLRLLRFLGQNILVEFILIGTFANT